MTQENFDKFELIYAPHEALETQAHECIFSTNEEALANERHYRQQLSDRMWEIMCENRGIGLAANQVRLILATFVMKYDGERLDVYNPQILEVSEEKTLMLEGCLSEPGLYLKVKRPAAVRVSYEDVNCERHITDMYGMNARVFLHEWDHLQGVMFTDRVGKVKLDVARKKQRKTLAELEKLNNRRV